MTSQFSVILRGWSLVPTWVNSDLITWSLHHEYFAANQNELSGYLVGLAPRDGGPRHQADKSCTNDGTIYYAKLRAWYIGFGHGRDPAE